MFVKKTSEYYHLLLTLSIQEAPDKIVLTGVILALIDNVLSVYASKGIIVRENSNIRHFVDFLLIVGRHRFKGDFARVSITSTEGE